jgi:hypothetical protein
MTSTPAHELSAKRTARSGRAASGAKRGTFWTLDSALCALKALFLFSYSCSRLSSSICSL